MDQKPEEKVKVGYVVGGSLKESLIIRLTKSPQEVQEGAFVVLKDGAWNFYGLVTNILLGNTNPRFADEPIEDRLPAYLARQLHGQTLFTNLEVLPTLMMDKSEDASKSILDLKGPIPVKTIPPHNTDVFLADEDDIGTIFGHETDPGNFRIGSTREQGLPVCISLDKFVQRSSGIFGSTGSGKSFLTRIILAGLIHYDRSSVLIFDMHNEYGVDDIASDTNKRVQGLKSKFAAKVRLVGLGRGASIRGQNPDFNLEIAEKDIRPEDIELLSRELNLKETTPTTLEALVNCFGERWFSEFKLLQNGKTEEDENGKRIPAADSTEGWALANGVNAAAAAGLRSKMSRLFNLPYVVETPAADSLTQIINALEAGQHVVLSFGKHERDLDYLLVTNLLTRKIRERWEQTTNKYRSQGEKEPRPLVVVVEEAHKLLNREMAGQTSFSIIAREMRKYYVTLLIVDQRPSQIYDEVMSQLGTRITGKLEDDSDLSAVLAGVAGKETLRGMLAHLQPKEEVLLLGWGVPMPIPVRSRRYDERFWEELLGKAAKKQTVDEMLKSIGQ
jgi:DNA helicase HerA-like ATPase